jgi:hypothetical protein
MSLQLHTEPFGVAFLSFHPYSTIFFVNSWTSQAAEPSACSLLFIPIYFLIVTIGLKWLFLESFNHFVYGVEELGRFYVPEAHLLASSTP